MPDYDFPKMERAREAIQNLHKFFEEDASPEFGQWFKNEFDVPFD
ncbi:MAG: hypothetical protein QM747_15390 [Nocardioides sp.]